MLRNNTNTTWERTRQLWGNQDKNCPAEPLTGDVPRLKLRFWLPELKLCLHALQVYKAVNQALYIGFIMTLELRLPQRHFYNVSFQVKNAVLIF